MAEEHDTYHYGNATVKKRYLELIKEATDLQAIKKELESPGVDKSEFNAEEFVSLGFARTGYSANTHATQGYAAEEGLMEAYNAEQGYMAAEEDSREFKPLF